MSGATSAVNDEVADDDTERFEGVTCLACGLLHFVNPHSGKVLGADDD